MGEIRHFRPAGPVAARQDAAPMVAPTRGSAANQEKYCVYNQTGERFVATDVKFVATDVKAADASSGGVEARLRALGQDAGAGLWILPYMEISPTSIRFPVDLVFLDNDCVVLATVESFPLASLPDSSAKARSLLTLPAETVAKGEMRAGDQLIIAETEEMKQYLKRMRGAKAEAPIESTPAKAEIAGGEQAGAEERAASLPIEPGAWKKRLGTRSWLTNLLLGDPVDPRVALREELPGLIAYFFTGGTPMAQEVRDISLTGMYIVTNERWYPGTVIRVTLTDRNQPNRFRSITVHAKTVRWGSDGVGLGFVLEKGAQQGTEVTQLMERTLGVSRARIEAFLRKLKMP